MKDKKISEDQVYEDYKKGLTENIDLSKAVEKHHDMSKASVSISLRLDYALLQKIKEIAETDGLPYQTLIKILLRQAIHDNKDQNILEKRLLRLEEKVDLIANKSPEMF